MLCIKFLTLHNAIPAVWRDTFCMKYTFVFWFLMYRHSLHGTTKHFVTVEVSTLPDFRIIHHTISRHTTAHQLTDNTTLIWSGPIWLIMSHISPPSRGENFFWQRIVWTVKSVDGCDQPSLTSLGDRSLRQGGFLQLLIFHLSLQYKPLLLQNTVNYKAITSSRQ